MPYNLKRSNIFWARAEIRATSNSAHRLACVKFVEMLNFKIFQMPLIFNFQISFGVGKQSGATNNSAHLSFGFSTGWGISNVVPSFSQLVHPQNLELANFFGFGGSLIWFWLWRVIGAIYQSWMPAVTWDQLRYAKSPRSTAVKLCQGSFCSK